jgi:hypothetical protein
MKTTTMMSLTLVVPLHYTPRHHPHQHIQRSQHFQQQNPHPQMPHPAQFLRRLTPNLSLILWASLNPSLRPSLSLRLMTLLSVSHRCAEVFSSDF